MTEEKLKAIVLRAVPFKDKQVILTLLSEERGVVSMIVKGLSKQAHHLVACTNPLCEAEFIFTEGRSELLRCKQASVLDPHIALRQKYAYLELGMRFVKVLLDTQYHGKPSSSLYALISSFLKQIPSFDEALSSLHCSFLLKILKHEGLLHLDSHCAVCEESSDIFFSSGDIYCRRHKPSGALFFSGQEWKTIEMLSHASSFSLVKQIPIEEPLTNKILMYFQAKINPT